ncbi:hypothetical protein [Halobacillus salinus]|uniref:Glycosyltransferase RgtA/B/C/D-like domain-containing protein n=1 Tax=Halobacillus salinus TaxID=192814 RepID=A0A4Z0H0D8_9BACI|nr:hypothetical protein [Halobacillus salinus]TGB02493.1 hypothetical protein E4663_14250 [Halobacillus salinus]
MTFFANQNKGNLGLLKNTLLFISLIVTIIFYRVINVSDAVIPLIILFILITIITGVYFVTNKMLSVFNFTFWILLFIVKVIFVYTYFIWGMVPFPDSFFYFDTLEKIRISGNLTYGSITDIAGTPQIGYSYFIYFVTELFKNDFSLYLINIFMFNVSLVLIKEVVKQDFGRKIANTLFFVSLLSGNLFIFTSFVLKDCLVLFLTTLTIYLYKNKKKPWFLLVIPLLVLTRIYAGFSIIVALAVDVLLRRKINRKTKVRAIVVGVAFGVFFLSNPILSRYKDLVIQFIMEIDVANALIVIPQAIVKMFIAPLPWNIIGDKDIYSLVLFDSIISLLFSAFLIMAVVKMFKYSDLRVRMYLYVIPILIHAAALGIEYGGDSARQRTGVMFFIILIFIVGAFNTQSTKLDDRSSGIERDHNN